MTDKYQENHDADSFAESHTEGHQDGWSDQNPPADDFADIPEEASVQVEGDEPDAAAGAGNADGAAPKKKASMLLPVAVGLAGLIFLGGMVYMQFFSGPEIPVPVAQPAKPIVAAATSPVPDAAAAPHLGGNTTTGNVVAASQQPFDPLSVKRADGAAVAIQPNPQPQVEQHPTLTGMPAPVLQSETALPSKQPETGSLVQPPAGNVSSVEPSPTMPTGQNQVAAQNQPMPSAGNIPMPSKSGSDAAKSPTLVTPTTNAGVTTPVINAAPVTSGVADNHMKDRVDELQRAVDKLTQQLDQVGGTVASIHNAPQVPAGLEDRLGRLEQELIKLQQTASAKSVVVHEERKTTPKMSHKTTAVDAGDEVMVHHAVTKHKSVSAKKSGKQEPKSKMVLRAAAPGEAWVANDAATSDLKQVHVGDHLAGVGEVTSIRQDDKGWLIEGTKGALR